MVRTGLIAVFLFTSLARAAERVDLVLLLAVDVSGSVSDSEYDVQHRGTVEALNDPVVYEAIQACTPGGVAIGYAEWGGRRLVFNLKRFLIEPFAKIQSREDLRDFADRVGSRERTANFTTTDVGGAIFDGVDAIDAAPFTSARRTIDVSSDGLQGPAGPDGEPALTYLTRARDEAVRRDVTVNALVFDPLGTEMNLGNGEWGPLETYWQTYVIGGPGAFTMKIKGPEQFRDALVRKLRREICEAVS